MTEPRSTADDLSLAAAVGVGAFLRAAPLVAWGLGRCVRDECSYRQLAKGIVAGDGLTATDGWLWAPGYPYLLSLFEGFAGNAHYAKYLQVGLAVVTTWMMAQLGERVGGRRVGLAAAWLFALHPTLAFFAGTLWSETVYSFLLVAAVLSLLWAREGAWKRALVPGALVGLAVLFRGVAQYMAPIFALSLLWPGEEAVRDALRARWRHAAGLLLAVVVTVAPWSVHASLRHGGFVLSDATLGQMMWLGDNDFPPVSFDYGNGPLRQPVMKAWSSQGRKHCDMALPAGPWNACEVGNAKAWIAEHPTEFASRVPLRVAQLVTPHSFLTRHLRHEKWPGLPFWQKESLAVWAALTTAGVLVGGTLGAAARARGPFGVLSVLVVAYHVGAIALVAGLSRYRVPLEHLWLIHLAVLVADPRGTVDALVADKRRVLAAVLALAGLLPLMFWFLPEGFPGWPR